MVAAFDGSERPYEVHFEGVTFFSKADEQFAEEYQPQYVIEASRGKTADSHWLRVSGNEDSPLFEVHYRTASWQRLAWVEVGGRRFDGDATTLYGMPSWKVRVIAYGAVILFGAIFLLYSLWQQGFFRK